MRLLIVITSFFTLSFIFPDNEVIVWQKNRPLTWDDFKGKPAKRYAIASTNYDIKKTVEPLNHDSALVSIKAIFFCNKSWKKKNWVDESVLMHEQKHFDIVELYARKLRKLLLTNTYTSESNLKIKSDSLYAIIDKEMDAYQDKYDEETEGSMNGEQQRLWNTKIANQINELDDFAGIAYRVGFKKK